MAKSINVEHKKRGRPATGRAPNIGIRLPPALIAEVDAWAAKSGGLTRSEAVRRLIERGLSKGPAKPKRSTAERAADATYAEKAAGAAVDRSLRGSSHPPNVRAERKKRLTKVPSELKRPPKAPLTDV